MCWDCNPGLGEVHALTFLENNRGRYMQSEGYVVYDKLTEIDRLEGRSQLVHCRTHIRRRFVKCFESCLANCGRAAASDRARGERVPPERVAITHAVSAAVALITRAEQEWHRARHVECAG
jgi:hypothetical protein